jgi:hypothetical protein
MEGLNSWLQEVDAFLQAEEDLPVGDVETLEAQLEQSNVSSSGMFSSGSRLLRWRIVLTFVLKKWIIKLELDINIAANEMCC